MPKASDDRIRRPWCSALLFHRLLLFHCHCNVIECVSACQRDLYLPGGVFVWFSKFPGWWSKTKKKPKWPYLLQIHLASVPSFCLSTDLLLRLAMSSISKVNSRKLFADLNFKVTVSYLTALGNDSNDVLTKDLFCLLLCTAGLVQALWSTGMVSLESWTAKETEVSYSKTASPQTLSLCAMPPSRRDCQRARIGTKSEKRLDVQPKTNKTVKMIGQQGGGRCRNTELCTGGYQDPEAI